ncbi:Sfum_1244 family protein, partial [Thermodesulfobacteriota bacterium]
DLYKWEKGLDPWVEKDSSEILEWIGKKEEEWDNLADKDFVEISILGKRYDPFDAIGINAFLEPHGLFYGAGYARSLRPTFFLAALEDKKEMAGHTVYILGKELARDLLTIPALSQDNLILIRKESGVLYFWDQIFFINKSGRRALRFALNSFGLGEHDPATLHRNLKDVFSTEIEKYIRHELGEAQDTVFNRDLWREIIATFPHTPIELLARTVKDLLADTNEHGTLPYITRKRRTASLAFYVAFLNGLAKELFFELPEAFSEFTQTGDWRLIEKVVSEGRVTAKNYARSISRIYRKGKKRNDMKWAEKEMNERLLAPLGIVKASSNEHDIV